MAVLWLFTVAISTWQAQKVAGSGDWRRPLPPARSRESGAQTGQPEALMQSGPFLRASQDGDPCL